MAFDVDAGARFDLSIKFLDDGGQETVVTVEIPFDTDVGQTLDNALSVANAYEGGASAMAVNEAWIRLNFIQDSIQTPIAKSSKFQDGQISVSLNPTTTSLDEFGIIRLPDPVDAVRAAASGKGKFTLDVSDPLITAITDKFAPGTGVATLSDGQNVASVDSGKVIVKKGKIKYQ